MEQLRVLVIGCGRVFRRHHLPALKELQRRSVIEIAGCVDPHVSPEDVGLPHSMPWYDDIEDALSDDAREFQVAVILLPDYLHYPASAAALEAGLHVFCEHPLTLRTEEADHIIAHAEANKLRLAVGHVGRFERAYEMAAELVAIGAIGAPVRVLEERFSWVAEPEANWWRDSEKSGGLIINTVLSHGVDTTLHLIDDKPLSLFAWGATLRPQLWEGPDETMVCLTTQRGVQVNLCHSYNYRGHNEARHHTIVIGTERVLTISGRKALSLNGEPYPFEEPADDRWVRQLLEFFHAIRQNREPSISGIRCRRVVSVLEAVRRSIQSGDVEICR
jgi:UDP-N-acetylglucosamine 3-dehydrogenase